MSVLGIDIETYSPISLKNSGVYRYVDDPDFKILLFAYAFDDEPVVCVDLTKDTLPDDVLKALTDKNVIKTAFNANFERTCISKGLGIPCPPEQWFCTMVLAMMAGLPGNLDGASKALGFPEDKQKNAIGKRLISYFSVPCKPTKANGGRTRNLPEHDPEKWNTFIEYNKQDVVVERELRKKISYRMLKSDKLLWDIDQKIADRGVGVDKVLAEKAIELNEKNTRDLLAESKKLTGCENPNSRDQIKAWVENHIGRELKSLDKATITELLISESDPIVRRVLKIRQQTSKTSVKKYSKMLDCRCSDGRAHGILQFYGASRTGRWAGRLIQLQNLPANHLPLQELKAAREMLRAGDYEGIDMFWDIPDVSSQLVRTALIPSEGMRFIVSDFSAIEARVIAWLAGEKWRQDVFKGDGKIYEASASMMFDVPIEKITKGSALRKKGKVAELACGYGGGVGALYAMGGEGIVEPEDWEGSHEDYMQDIIRRWRKASPAIVKLWWDVDRAAKKAISEKTTVTMQFGLQFIGSGNLLSIRLPSGRRLSYISPKIEPHEVFDRPKITYMGMNQEKHKWCKLDTYGPKLVENIVQGIARDCLAVSIINLEKEEYPILFHVHDEIITERKRGEGSLQEVYDIMGRAIDWAPGLLLRADGYECDYYYKD